MSNKVALRCYISIHLGGKGSTPRYLNNLFKLLLNWNLCIDNYNLGPAAAAAAAAAKSLQSCPTLCNPIDESPPGSAIPGILQARTLEWVAISFSNIWKWKVKSESEVAQSCPTPCGPHGLQPTRLIRPWDFPGKSTGVGCHCLLRKGSIVIHNIKRKRKGGIWI